LYLIKYFINTVSDYQKLFSLIGTIFLLEKDIGKSWGPFLNFIQSLTGNDDQY